MSIPPALRGFAMRLLLLVAVVGCMAGLSQGGAHAAGGTPESAPAAIAMSAGLASGELTGSPGLTARVNGADHGAGTHTETGHAATCVTTAVAGGISVVALPAVPLEGVALGTVGGDFAPSPTRAASLAGPPGLNLLCVQRI